MTQPNQTEPYDPEAIADYRQQAHVFLTKARQYLADNDLHQASEKGWGAAAWMAKAVATIYDWEYQHHQQFGVVMDNAALMTGNNRIIELKSIAYGLHTNYYTRKRFLSPRAIAQEINLMAELLTILEPLTHPAANDHPDNQPD